jgi:hypothetical protein
MLGMKNGTASKMSNSEMEMIIQRDSKKAIIVCFLRTGKTSLMNGQPSVNGDTAAHVRSSEKMSDGIIVSRHRK